MKVQTLKNNWIQEQYQKIKMVVSNDFSDEEIYSLLEEKWNNRREPKNVLMMDKFLNSNYIFTAYGVLYKQPTEHTSIFNDVIWDVIKQRGQIRKYIKQQREARGEEFMIKEFTRWNSKQKNRKIVVNAAYGVI